MLAINLIGAGLLGALTAHVRHGNLHRLLRPLLGPGFCGAFTTFSTLQLELYDMVERGHLGLALLYAAVSMLGGLLAVLAGARTLTPAATEPDLLA